MMKYKAANSDVILRCGQIEDCENLAALCIAHAKFEGVDLKTTNLASKLRNILSQESKSLFVIVAELDEQLVGYATATKEFSTWMGETYLHMDCLYVVEHMRGKRIGRELFKALKNQANFLEMNQMQWQTPSWNEDAMRFYDKLGAKSQSKMRFTLDL